LHTWVFVSGNRDNTPIKYALPLCLPFSNPQALNFHRTPLPMLCCCYQLSGSKLAWASSPWGFWLKLRPISGGNSRVWLFNLRGFSQCLDLDSPRKRRPLGNIVWPRIFTNYTWISTQVLWY